MSIESRLQRLESAYCGPQFALIEQQPGESREQARERAEALAARHPGQMSSLIVYRSHHVEH